MTILSNKFLRATPWNTGLILTRFMPDDFDIVTFRQERNHINAEIPYHFLHEQEIDKNGILRKVNTVFLTGKECSFKCLMCDLWKNTLTSATPPGAILKQIDYALKRLPPADIIKLYNSSNFFDSKAVPLSDYPGIIERVRSFKKVIVENHPNLCGSSCVDFNGRIDGKLEIAMGLETIHPNVLPRLNKKLTVTDFKKAATFLQQHNIQMRAFVLLNPPFLTGQDENVEWALKTIDFAFDCGVGCCSVIPTRKGNGIMEELEKRGDYVAPTLASLEHVMEKALALKKGRVFADTWDIGFLARCNTCFEKRKLRLEEMNFTQKFLPKINCNCS
jgi:radical SAM enzyme (TIGR01210 family)